MKKLLAIVCAGLLSVCLFACSSGGTNPSSGSTSNEAEPTQDSQNASQESADQEQASNTEAPTTTEPETAPADAKAEYKIGETWTVDGQWELTITSVTEIEERNESASKEAGAVYLVDYTYTNIGFEDPDGFMDGLYLVVDDSIIDAAGKMGFSYPGDIVSYPQETPVGATCDAQACIGVENPGGFKLNVMQYDGSDQKQSATFLVEVE